MARADIARAVWHTSFTVTDLERSERFYVDGLGLAVVHRQEQEGGYTSRLVGYPDAHLLVIQLAIPGAPTGPSGHHVELVQYLHPPGDAQQLRTCDPGTAHLAFVVDDIYAAAERLQTAGADFVSAPNRIDSGVNAGGAACYFRDPDGVTLEIVQPPPARESR